ncbi:hypothetical protein BH11ARM2_BH11ARM2_05750 [soil metagenome]
MMKIPLAWMLATTAAAAVIFGCGGGGGGGSTTSTTATTDATNATGTTAVGPSGYQFVNLSPGTTTQLTLDGTVKANGLAFGGRSPGSDLADIDPGSHAFKIDGTSSSETASEEVSEGIDGDKVFQFFSVGIPGGSGNNAYRLALIIDGSRSLLDKSKSIFRVFHADPGLDVVDVFVTATDASLETATPNVDGLGRYGASGRFTMTPGTYRIRVTATGTKSPVLADQTFTFDARRIGTVAIVPNGEDVALNAYVSPF